MPTDATFDIDHAQQSAGLPSGAGLALAVMLGSAIWMGIAAFVFF
ncbi:MAG: hypothetical protein R3D60_00835 [Paracoccaceae bacterium]